MEPEPAPAWRGSGRQLDEIMPDGTSCWTDLYAAEPARASMSAFCAARLRYGEFSVDRLQPELPEVLAQILQLECCLTFRVGPFDVHGLRGMSYLSRDAMQGLPDRGP